MNRPSGGLEVEHPLHIPGRGHKAPLALYVFEPGQEKLAESERGFDDAEDWLGDAFALGVELFAFGRLQAVNHGFNGRWILRRGRRLGKPLAQRRVMVLPARGDERLDPGRRKGLHVGLAEKAVIGQYDFGLAEFFGQLVLASIGSSSRLSFGAWVTPFATTSKLSSATTAWAL